ncbi:hypothetical protein [Dokdonella sp.]|uniref:hypothetical protein n=1 Tax=Dokdonella sp. TaxID=2291710 RepID=UPI003783DACE
MRAALLLSTMAMLSIGTARADDVCTEAAKKIADATAVYVEKGAAAFWERVLKDGPLEGDKRSIGQVQALGQIEQFFGQIQSSSILSKKAIGKKDCYVVWMLEYSDGPAFAVANYYQSKKGVVATSMNFKTEPEAVLPTRLLVD